VTSQSPAASLSAGTAAVDIPAVSEITAVPAEPAGRMSRSSRLTVPVGILTAIALVAALYLARAFFVPLLIGILASYALSPVADWLELRRVPRAIAAALVLAVLVGAMSFVAVTLRDEAAAMIEKLPDAARKLRQKLVVARASGTTALQNMQEAANEIQGAATDAGAKAGARVIAIKPAEPTAWLRDYALAQSALLVTVAAQTPIVLLLTYFLLASGSHFRRKLVQLVGPSLARKKDAVRILEEVDVQVQRYLLTVLLSNMLVAVCTWLAFAALGVEQAGVWGVAAGVLHFIPYLGPLLIALVSGVVAFLQFGTPLDALLVAGTSLLVAGTVGFVFMTWLQSRFARVNAAVLFIALLFFGWLWGASGLLLGAPLVAILKVICDRVVSLEPVGELLGR
jgi:predicted PurR-regulated permease PerM